MLNIKILKTQRILMGCLRLSTHDISVFHFLQIKNVSVVKLQTQSKIFHESGMKKILLFSSLHIWGKLLGFLYLECYIAHIPKGYCGIVFICILYIFQSLVPDVINFFLVIIKTYSLISQSAIRSLLIRNFLNVVSRMLCM